MRVPAFEKCSFFVEDEPCGTLIHMEQQGQTPRAERFPTDSKILYSEVARLAWHAGFLVNVSSSGLLFEGTHPVQVGTPIEMTFTLPQRVFADEAEQVYCTGLVVRDASGYRSGEELVSHMAAHITTWQRIAERPCKLTRRRWTQYDELKLRNN